MNKKFLFESTSLKDQNKNLNKVKFTAIIFKLTNLSQQVTLLPTTLPEEWIMWPPEGDIVRL